MKNINLRGARYRPNYGGTTSAASIKDTAGFNDTHKVRVENGKLISWWECLKSVDDAADRFLAIHCGRK
jgi:hypothetical protein